MKLAQANGSRRRESVLVKEEENKKWVLVLFFRIRLWKPVGKEGYAEHIYSLVGVAKGADICRGCF